MLIAIIAPWPILAPEPPFTTGMVDVAVAVASVFVEVDVVIVVKVVIVVEESIIVVRDT